MREMKYSGVEWMEDIPASWNMIRFKDKYQSIKEIAGESSSEYERLALTLGGVIKRPKDDSEGLQPKAFDGYQILRENDFVFKMIDLQNVSTSRVGLSPYTGLVSPAYIRFCSKNKNQFNKFVYYYLMSMYYNCVFNSLGGDGVRSALNASDMGMLMIPFPSEHEQMLIVEAIESQTDKVDAIIANQEAQIVKLKAYKQSLITEVVTKGLDPNVPLKDSGMEWVESIPEHWETVQLSSVVTERKHKNTGMIEDNLLSLSYGYIKRKDIKTSDGLLPESFEGYNIVEKGDIVLRLTDLQNDHTSLRTGLCNERGIITSAYVTLQNKGDVILSEYLHYVLHAFDICKGFYGMGAGVRQGLNYDGVKKVIVLKPSLSEQKEICEFIAKKEVQIERLIAIKKQKIEKLNQYKKSLIYEYVTGKKEVQ